MGFTLDSIKNKITKEDIFYSAKSMTEENKVKLDNIKSIGRGETEMNGFIEREGMPDETVETQLVVNNEGIVSYHCSECVTRYSMCVHEAATALAYYRYLYQNTAMKTATSDFMRGVIDSCVKNSIWDTMRDEYGTVSLVPKLTCAADSSMKIGFKIKKDKKEYVIQDLAEFCERIRNEETCEYSKTFSMKHSVWVFDKESRELLMLLIEAIEEELAIYLENNRNKSKDSFKLKELKYERSYARRMIELMAGDIVELELKDKTKRNCIIEMSNPKLSLTVKETLLGGYRLEINEDIQTIAGLNSILVLKGNHLYVCDNEYSTALKDILPKMSAETYREDTFSISKRDMPLFYGQMLKSLKKYIEIDDHVYQNEDNEQALLEVGFRFDLGKQNEVICEETFIYGNFSFNPFKGGSVPVGIYRDYPAEYKAKNVAEYFFGSSVDVDGRFILTHEDEVYRLVDEGIPLFMEMGNVYLSESFKGIKIVSAPRTHVAARIDGGMLQLDFDIENFDREELRNLLASYRQRKKYYRLKSGEFVRMADNSLAVITELADSLKLSDDKLDMLLDGSLLIPKYRALYLENVINQGGDIHFDRDKDLRKLIRSIKEVEDSDYEVPETLKKTVRKYQRTGYRWLKALAYNGFGGILADDMGLGKTLQVITLLLSHKEKNAENANRQALIVCPASLVYNWDDEIRKFAPELSVAVVSGSITERKELISGAKDKDIVVTSYDSLRRDIELYKDMKFAYQIIDEAQFIKNPSTQNAKSVKKINAEVKFALTGTPIENRLSELWSIFDYLMPGFLYSYAQFREEFEYPIVKDEDRVILNRLQNMIKPFVLRRLKADVLKDLPEKQETVVYSKLSEEQLGIYAANVAEFRKELSNISEEELASKRMHVLAQLMRLRQICCDPALCYDNYKHGSAKLEGCLELVRDAVESGHKILLFSQFTTMLDKIAGYFDEEGISYYVLTGDTPKQARVRMAAEFNVDDTKVFLISLKAGGTGLNLTGADIVIHYDPWWNVAVQNQATDRAHRIGQSNKVNVYKLIAKDTIEEKILKLQESKEKLAESIVSEEVSKLTALTKEELLGLLD